LQKAYFYIILIFRFLIKVALSKKSKITITTLKAPIVRIPLILSGIDFKTV